MERYGFKALTRDLKNRYGEQFSIGEIKEVNGEIKWGVNGNGYHYCEHIEDCFRYVDAFNDDIVIAVVKAYGDEEEYNDDYYGYYNMFVTRAIEIIDILNRDEIIEAVLNTNNPYSYKKFITTFPLTENELSLFTDRLPEIKKDLNVIHETKNGFSRIKK